MKAKAVPIKAKPIFYQPNGTGRDRFISTNNGGLLKQSHTPYTPKQYGTITQKKQMCFKKDTGINSRGRSAVTNNQSSKIYNIKSHAISGKMNHYISDGSGRDYYVTVGDGGVSNFAGGKGHDMDRFNQSLRKYYTSSEKISTFNNTRSSFNQNSTRYNTTNYFSNTNSTPIMYQNSKNNTGAPQQILNDQSYQSFQMQKTLQLSQPKWVKQKNDNFHGSRYQLNQDPKYVFRGLEKYKERSITNYQSCRNNNNINNQNSPKCQKKMYQTVQVYQTDNNNDDKNLKKNNHNNNHNISMYNRQRPNTGQVNGSGRLRIQTEHI